MHILICLALFICSIIFLIDLAIWGYDRGDIINKIKFRSFESFYNVNPKRWTLKNGYVVCNDPRSCFGTKFTFNYIDYKRYKRFIRNIEKNNKNIQSNKNYARMIELVKSDIAKIEAQSASELETSVKTIRGIINNDTN